MQPVCGEGFECGYVVDRMQTYAEWLLQQATAIGPMPSAPEYWQWAVIGLSAFVIGFLLFDWWLYKTKGVTYSRWSQWKSRVTKWFAVATIAVLAVFGWHVIWGFPERTQR